MKQLCKYCNIEKTLDRFSKKSNSKTGYAYKCKDCHNKYVREVWYKKNAKKQIIASKRWKEKNRAKVLSTRYNIDKNSIEELILEKKGKCFICGKKDNNLCFDHCHKKNKARGFLCKKCNLGIGYFNDDVDILKSAIKYLNKDL